MPLFSVIIPTKDRLDRVTRAVDSVLKQTCADYDIWVVDDGHDDTRTALARMSESIRYLRGPARGVAAGRNMAVKASAGEYLAFLDADDWWYSDKLDRMAALVRADARTALFYSPMDYVDEHGRVLWTARSSHGSGDAYVTLLSANCIVNSSVVVSRAALERVGCFDTELSGCEDWDLWIRVAREFPIHFVPRTLGAYEYLSTGSFSSDPMTWIRAHDEVVDKAFGHDTRLSARDCRRIRSGIAYVKGRICISAGCDELARTYFREAIALRWTGWRSWPYAVLLQVPGLRTKLPRSLQSALRLPETWSGPRA